MSLFTEPWYPEDNELEHYGVLGMKWGVRRTPEQLGHANLKRAKTANFDKWGKSPETNILWITGRSGSGKSTIARSIARSNDPIIHLDVYCDAVEPGESAGERNDEFSSHLDRTVSRWRELALSDDKTDLRRYSKEYWDVIDDFAVELGKFSEDQYKLGNRVIVEGFQIAGRRLYRDYDFYKGQPMIILGTGKLQSLMQEFVRDERTDFITAVREYFSKSGTTWSSAWDEKLSEITQVTNAKRGDKAVSDFLEQYGQRKA